MSLLSGFCRIYPLVSGRGTLANSKLFKALDGNNSGDTLANVSGYQLWVPKNDYVGRAIIYFGDLDRKISWVVERVLKPGDSAMDIGANLGLVSFQMLRQVGPEGDVVCFEPQSRMAGYLEKSMVQNQIRNLHLHRCALGESQGSLELSVPDGNAGAASLISSKNGKVESVEVMTLDDLVARTQLKTPKLIKIDVEGFEASVMRGGNSFFTDKKPSVVVFEEHRSHGNEQAESIAIMQTYGYDIFALPKSLITVSLVPLADSPEAHDFVAVHKTASKEIRTALGIP